MPRFDGKSELVKAAWNRLNDARSLLSASEGRRPSELRTQGSKYLAGYAVECILKVYIIHQQNTRTLREAVDTLRERERKRPEPRVVPDLLGVAGHNLENLVSWTDLESQFDARSEIGRAWNICMRWSSTWRYSPKQPTIEDARQFVDAVDRVYRWVKAKL